MCVCKHRDHCKCQQSHHIVAIVSAKVMNIQGVNDEVEEDVQPVVKLQGDARDVLNAKKQ